MAQTKYRTYTALYRTNTALCYDFSIIHFNFIVMLPLIYNAFFNTSNFNVNYLLGSSPIGRTKRNPLERNRSRGFYFDIAHQCRYKCHTLLPQTRNPSFRSPRSADGGAACGWYSDLPCRRGCDAGVWTFLSLLFMV
jgi:hypothetical protein